MRPELEIAPDARGLALLAADWVEELLRSEAAAGRPLSIALAGGSTPAPLYAELAARHRTRPLPWDGVTIYFGDERCVPPDDPESNWHMAHETLLEPVGESSFAAVHRIRGECPDADAEARRYDDLLPEALGLVLLGMGEDGHTASLFPRHPALMETERRVVAVEGPKPPPRRITFTPVPIVAAERVLLLAAGPGKAPAVARALDGPEDPHATPVQLARSTDPRKVRRWILDEAAVAELDEAWR